MMVVFFCGVGCWFVFDLEAPHLLMMVVFVGSFVGFLVGWFVGLLVVLSAPDCCFLCLMVYCCFLCLLVCWLLALIGGCDWCCLSGGGKEGARRQSMHSFLKQIINRSTPPIDRVTPQRQDNTTPALPSLPCSRPGRLCEGDAGDEELLT